MSVLIPRRQLGGLGLTLPWALRIKRTGSSATTDAGRYRYCLRMRSKAQHLDITCGPYTSLAAAQRYAQAAVDQYRLAIEPAAVGTPTDPAPVRAAVGKG